MKKYIPLLVIFISLSGCQKYLDEKPNQALALPTDNIDNLKYLLSDTYTMNLNSASAGEVASDNFYFSDAVFQRLSQASLTSSNLYLWNPDVFNDNDQNDWTLGYKVIFNSNVVLDALKALKPTSVTQLEWNNVRGVALFFRSWSFLNLLQEFSRAYDPGTADKDLGVALRLTSDINLQSTRATVQQCYDQVVNDLTDALPLLPMAPDFKTTPSKLAALALLARAYLFMGNYGQALNYANQYLALAPGLVDYNTLSVSSAYPFSRYNEEVTFHVTGFQIPAYSSAYAHVSDSLYAQYNTNDLRRALFFKGSPGNIVFRGSYDGTRSPFAGIATDEMYLTAAECYARAGKVSDAVDMLNSLMIKRFSTGTFVPYSAADANKAIKIILAERRKELIYRNIRWADLKRLNREGTFPVALSRLVAEQTYMLEPNDPRYVMPLPEKVIQLSGMPQN